MRGGGGAWRGGDRGAGGALGGGRGRNLRCRLHHVMGPIASEEGKAERGSAFTDVSRSVGSSVISSHGGRLQGSCFYVLGFRPLFYFSRRMSAVCLFVSCSCYLCLPCVSCASPVSAYCLLMFATCCESLGYLVVQYQYLDSEPIQVHLTENWYPPGTLG